MTDQHPGSLTASRIATLRPGIVAEAVIDERTDCLGRWHSGGSWSPWRLIAAGARDVAVAAIDDDGEPAALVSVVVLTPMPIGGIPAAYLPYQRFYYRLTASGVTPAGL